MTHDTDLLAALTGTAQPSRRVVLCTVVDSSGSVPQRPGARLALGSDGRLVGTIGGGAVEQLVLAAARELLARGGTKLLTTHLTRDLGMCCGGRLTVFLQTLDPPENLLLFGAGHVAKPLAALARTLAFRVLVVDERPEWANAERFPGVELRVEPPLEVLPELPFDERASICVVTHDHRLDQEVVEACLRKPYRYLGVIGSRRKGEMFRQRLQAKGFAEAAVAALHCPMGVAIGAQTPEEIAVSIAGELVAARRSAAAPADAEDEAAEAAR
ncbi:MAG TPA: xanthine dehydrogenase accessory protein XdhC [Myxococcales bacterium]|nr:xanthine dehydrogenase accessory protein XdhC [Myxococcales bacterium]